MTQTLTGNDVVDDPILSWPVVRTPPWSVNAPTAIVGDQRRQDEFAGLIAKVASYGELKANWDFDGGLAADPRVVRFVIGLLQRLQPYSEVPAPVLRPISTGAFLCWTVNDREFYIEADAESVLAVERRGGKSVLDCQDRQFNAEAAASRVFFFFDLQESL